MRNALALALFLAACGGGSDNNDKTATDASTTKKDGTTTNPGTDGTPVPTCHVNSTITYTATADAIADEDANPPTSYLAFDDNLNSDAMPDILEVYLTPGQGVFTDGLKTGTFTISGDETDWGACGACVTIYGDSPDPTMFDYTQLYQASSGSVTINSITTNLSGEIKNVVLKAVTFDSDTGTQADDGSGCTATIADATFTAPITDDSMFAGGKHGGRVKLHLKRK